MPTKQHEWSKLYAPEQINSWRLPGSAIVNRDEGAFSKLFLRWSDLSKGQNEPPEEYVICADVLYIDVAPTVQSNTYIFARRIEVGPNINLTLNRSDEPVALLLVAQEVVTRDGGQPTQLKVSVVNAGPGKTEDSYTADTYPQVLVKEWGEEPEPTSYGVGKLDEGYMLEGESLRLHLRCIFQLATLLSTEKDLTDLAVRQLNWVAALSSAAEDTHPIGGEARAMAAYFQSINAQKDNVFLVPDLDHSVYRESAQALLQLLERTRRKQDALEASAANRKNWLRCFSR